MGLTRRIRRAEWRRDLKHAIAIALMDDQRRRERGLAPGRAHPERSAGSRFAAFLHDAGLRRSNLPRNGGGTRPCRDGAIA